MKKRMMALVLSLCLTGLCFCHAAIAAGQEAAGGLFVQKVDHLPDDFIFGMDASIVIAEENSGVRYYGFDGSEQDVFKILCDSGINYIRVRVWNHPWDKQGRGYGGGNCDIENAVAIGRRASEYGMKLLVDFHYSDFWADPGKQMPPAAWKNMKIDEKEKALYRFTRECLKKLSQANVDVGMVQIGNETNGWLCGERDWPNITRLMKAGVRAVREEAPGALAALHFANPEQAGSYAYYARELDRYQVDYDVFATSYYPFWHGTLDNLAAVTTDIADKYGKKVLVVETSYPYTGEDTDFSGNTVGGDGSGQPYPFTVQGQANCIRDITDTVVNRIKNGIGVVYWEGCWISVGGSSREENSALWEKYGSGWASSYAAVYDPDDAGRYYGGSGVDNQALFDRWGRPLESLKVFHLMRTGSKAGAMPDALEDVSVTCDLNLPLSLPETVNAVMTDGSRQAVPVVWDLTEAEERAMHEGGPGRYEITGRAGGMTARCHVSMVEYNYLTDYSFEEGGTGWVITDLKKADELFVEDKKSDSKTGTKHMHFWSAKRDSVEFTVEQTVRKLPEGKFRFTVSIMGGDGGETDIYAYVKVNGKIVARAPMKITYFNVWDTVSVPVFEHKAGDEVTVGVYVKCRGTGSGAWGKIDDAMLNAVR